VAGHRARQEDETMLIDCDECVVRDTDACGDCIVTVLLDRPAGAVVFDVEEERAIRALQRAGLAPESRFAGPEEADGAATVLPLAGSAGALPMVPVVRRLAEGA
jgi:hypothetical protein